MEFCKNCGLLLPEGADHCPQCGAPVFSTPQPPQGAAEHPFYMEQEPPRAGMSTAGYLGCLVLFVIPVVGLIFMLVWSLDSGRHPARRNLARAYLIRTLILAALFFVVVSLLLLVASVSVSYPVYYPYYY